MVYSSPTRIGPSYDWLGLAASILCAIHCVATPFVFAAFPLLREAGGLWSMIDIGFLFISLFAVWGTVRVTGVQWVRYVGPIGWVVLALGVAAERVGVAGSDAMMYLGAAGLLVAHVANIRYCRRCVYCGPNE